MDSEGVPLLGLYRLGTPWMGSLSRSTAVVTMEAGPSHPSREYNRNLPHWQPEVSLGEYRTASEGFMSPAR